MTRQNTHYAKVFNGTLQYGPIPLTVVTHHHEEWDEDVYDEATGEPTGEKVHRTRDWETSVSRMRPTAADYLKMGYLPCIDAPGRPSPGHRLVPSGWEVSDGTIVRTYDSVPIPPPSLSDFDAAMEAHLRAERDARGYTTREPDCYMDSTTPRWAQDARDWVAHRDEVMRYALTLINAVKAGEREIPTMEEFTQGLPRIAWTYAIDGEGEDFGGGSYDSGSDSGSDSGNDSYSEESSDSGEAS